MDPFKELEQTEQADPFKKLEGVDTSDPFAELEQPYGEKPSYVESAIRGAAQGVSFNTAEELTGLTEALAAKAEGSRESFSDLYVRSRDASRAAYKAAEKANPKTFMASQIAAGVAVPGAGWLAAGKGIGTAARAGALAGGLSGFGAAEGDVGEQLKDTAAGAVIGGVGGAALAGVFKGAGAMLGGGKAAQAIADDLPELMPAAHKIKDTIPDNLDDALKGRDAQFMQYVLRTKVPETVEEAFVKSNGKQNQRVTRVMERALDNQEQFDNVLNQFSPKIRQQLYDEYRGAQALTQAARDLKSSYMNKLRVTDYDPVQGWMSWLRPANFNAQRVDAKYGSDFTGAILDAVDAENKLASGATPFLKQALSVEKEMAAAMKKSKFNNFDDFSRDLYMRVTQGKFKPGSLESKVVQYFDDARKTLNKEYGLNIQKLQPYGKQTVYLPRTRMDMDTMRLKLDRATDRLFSGAMPEKEQKAYWDAMRYLGKEFGEELDNTADKATLKSFIEKRLLKTAEERGAVKRLEAAAAFGRDHDLPPYIVEYDIPKLMANYINGNMKAGLYQVPMARMSAQIESARMLGMPKTAEYFQKVQDSLMGTPSDWKAKMQERASQWRLQGQRTLDDSSTPLGKMQGFFQKTLPDFVPWSMGNMYYNLLNLNPYSVMRNLTQPIMGGSTDIAARAGNAYAAKITAQGFKDLLRKGGGANPNLIGLANEGPVRNEATQAIVKGLRDSGVPEAVLGGIKGYEKASGLLMDIYSAADTVNRRWTLAMADRVADDFLRGNPSAAKVVADLPKGIKARISQAQEAGNSEAVREQLRRWFNIQHQYSYTNADMSRLGREFGSVLTAFTKFPTSVASDIENEFYRKGISGAFPVMRKYLFPLAALGAADVYTREAREDMDPKLKLVFGDNFRELSPALGLVVQPPPLVGAAVKAGDAVVKGTSALGDMEPEDMPEHVRKTGVKILDAAAPFLPGYGFFKITKGRAEKAGIIEPSEE